MKTLFSLLLFLVTSIPIYAQNSLQGKIKNSSTQEPLAFANIYFPQLEKGTISNENGEFLIKNLPNGAYKFVCSIIGYESFSSTIQFPANESLIVNLRASIIEMEEVILSTPFHKLQRDNVMKVEQAKISSLKSSGAINLSDGISNISGVESVSTGISIGKPVIRGLSSNRVLVYVQGIRLENQQFGDEHGLGVNDAGVESVEVIKGPASLLYGSDALGGVIYLNPEKFANQNSSSGDFNLDYYSNTQGYSTNIGYKSSSDKFKFIFRGSLTEHADYKTKDYRVTNTRFKEQDFKSAIKYQAIHFNSEFRYNLNASKLGIPEGIGIQNTNTDPLLPNQEINNHIFSSKSKLFLNNSSFELNLGFIYNDRKEFEEEHGHDEEENHTEEVSEAALHMKLKTFNYDLKYHLPQGKKFETIFGLQGMNQTNTNYGEEQLVPNAGTNDFGILTTSHIHFEKIDVHVGARFDNRVINIENGFSKNYNSFNGAIGFKKNVLNNVVVRLNLASGFRGPNLAELTSNGSHEGVNRYEIGNPNLKSEQNLQADFSIEYNSEHVELFANGFYNKINNYIFLSPNGDFINSDPVFLYLQDDAKLFGGEFGLHFHPHPLDWLHVESSFETVTGKQNSGEYLPLIPANKLNNTIRVEFENNSIKKAYAFITLNHTFRQDNINTFETITNRYSLLSSGFGGEIKLFNKPLFLRISVKNITNKVYVNHLSRLKPDSIANIGRNINFGMTYQL